MKPLTVFLPLLLLLSLSGSVLLAQQEIDSLLDVLEKNPPDSVKIDSYIALHTALVGEDTTRSMEYLRKATALSEQMGDAKRISSSYLKMCNYLWRKGRLNEAHEALDKVQEHLVSLNNAKIKATFHMESGIVYYNEGNYQEAANSFFNAISGYEALGDTLGVAKCLSNIGISYWELEELEQALEYYQRALKIVENTSNESTRASILGNIGLIYRAKGEHDKALDYYHQSLAINKKLDDKQGASINLQNIGVLYQKQGNYPLALDYLKQANTLSKVLNRQRGILYTNHGIAAIQAEMGNYAEALSGFEQTLQMAKTLNIKEEIKNVYESYSDTYERMGQYKPAYEYRKLYEIWKDSIASENHLNQIKELEVKYETDKKNQQIALLTVEKELQASEAHRQATWKKALMAGIILVVIIAGMLIFLLRQRLKNQKTIAAKNEEIKSSQFKRQLSELEMKALRAQMNPHFIFNCMNSINRMIMSGEGDDASRYLTKFAKLIRLMLENSENPTVSLEDELAMLEAYIQLESLRFKGKITYQISVDDSVDQENTLLPSMVLQPFIENAIWHGLMHKEGEGYIKIFIGEEDNVLKCVIEDNGVGREKALALKEKTVLKSKSMGLKITEERLKLLSKENLQELIRITDLKDALNRAIGTRVQVTIPINN